MSEEKKTQGNDFRNRKSRSQTNAEYFKALEQWLNEARTYTHTCNFFHGLSYAFMSQQIQGSNFNQYSNAPFLNNNFLTRPPLVNQVIGGYGGQEQPPEEGVEFRIPPLWKRFTAELLDFFILFLIKLPITFLAVDFFDFVDLDKYDLDVLQSQDKLDYKLALEMTSEILVLEIVHRIIVCVFEVICIRDGATPGKMCMGIKVVRCTSVQQVDNQPNVVIVYPATDLGLGWSIARALLKNLVIALLFPVCVPLFFNKFNRTGYDILCHSIVVEV